MIRLLYFNFKSFMDTISSSLIRFQSILHDSGVLFSECWNFYKLKRGDLISGGNQFCRNCELFGPLFFVSTLKVSWTQSHSHSLGFPCILHDILNSEVWLIGSPILYFNFKSFCIIQEYFSQSLEISTN